MSDATDFDYTLDERQIAMLDAMGIRVFQGEISDQKEPFARMESAQNAIEKVANTIPSKPVVAAPVIPQAAAAPAPTRPQATAITLTPKPEGIERMGWAELAATVKDCKACGLCQSRKNTVFGVGAPPALEGEAPQVDWLIVGEAPGENEDIQGEPFVGQAGKLLDNMLAAMKVSKEEAGKPKGLKRTENVYIANVLKCRPPANRNPSPEEVAMCEPYLVRQIELLKPKLILAMGRFAITTLTGSNEPVGKLRGRVHTAADPRITAPIIVTYHPAYLLRNLPDKAKAWADLVLAMQTMKTIKVL
jgi:uracil-DNA glycosylase